MEQTLKLAIKNFKKTHTHPPQYILCSPDTLELLEEQGIVKHQNNWPMYYYTPVKGAVILRSPDIIDNTFIIA